jgi:hypothetical protein
VIDWSTGFDHLSGAKQPNLKFAIALGDSVVRGRRSALICYNPLRTPILTITGLLAGKCLDMPPEWGTLKQAPRSERLPDAEQKSLFD